MGQNLAEVQKELLHGRYDISINEDLPFNHKVIQMAQEPIAFHLYKNRDFYQLSEEGIKAKQYKSTFQE